MGEELFRVTIQFKEPFRIRTDEIHCETDTLTVQSVKNWSFEEIPGCLKLQVNHSDQESIQVFNMSEIKKVHIRGC